MIIIILRAIVINTHCRLATDGRRKPEELYAYKKRFDRKIGINSFLIGLLLEAHLTVYVCVLCMLDW